MRSMTGFASNKEIILLNNSTVHVVLSMKSVNTRFFELTFKSPYALQHLETDLAKELKQQLIRGNVLVSIHISDQAALKGTISLSNTIAQGYIDAIKKMQQTTGIEGTLQVADILQLPHLFSVEEQPLDNNIKEQILQLAHNVTTLLIHEQEKEGAAIRTDLTERLAIVTKHIATIEQLHTSVMAEKKKTILNELQSYSKDDVTIETRKATLYYLLDKIDIHEEIIRFKSHLVNLQALITCADVEIGKRLDFTLQELGREINTIAAKCSDASIGSRAIDIKVELEKAREQAQNIV